MEIVIEKLERIEELLAALLESTTADKQISLKVTSSDRPFSDEEIQSAVAKMRGYSLSSS